MAEEKPRALWRMVPVCKKTSDKKSPEIEQKDEEEKDPLFDAVSARILGGQKVATTGEYPWQCLLITSDGSFCGCVVVAERMILTAAHCVIAGVDA